MSIIMQLKQMCVVVCSVVIAFIGTSLAQAGSPIECGAGVTRGRHSFSLQPEKIGFGWLPPRNIDGMFAGVPTVFPMPPEGALQAYQRGSERQALALMQYSATTLINVELPDMSRQGELEVRRVYVAPGSVEFTPLRFTGDRFVKTNVIARLLQFEVDHVRHQQDLPTTIRTENYKISYRSTTQIEGRLVHGYQVKPRKRRVGMFEGLLFLDAFTGSLVRKEGKLVRTPSFFLKNVVFVQDYVDIGGFTFPARVRSEARVRFIGRAIVHVCHYDYYFGPKWTVDGSEDKIVSNAEAPVSSNN